MATDAELQEYLLGLIENEDSEWRIDMLQQIQERLKFDPVRDVDEFHRKFGLAYDGKPRTLPDALLNYRVEFMKEEHDEYLRHAIAVKIELSQGSLDIDQANVTHHLEEMLDALIDLTYVVLGTAHYHGFNFREAWRRVHEKNMQKIRASGQRPGARDATFDVIKPPGWEPPSHVDLVEDHIHRK